MNATIITRNGSRVQLLSANLGTPRRPNIVWVIIRDGKPIAKQDQYTSWTDARHDMLKARRELCGE